MTKASSPDGWCSRAVRSSLQTLFLVLAVVGSRVKTSFASLEEQESHKYEVSVKPSQKSGVAEKQDKAWNAGMGQEGELVADDKLGRKRTQNWEGNGQEKPGFKEEIAK